MSAAPFFSVVVPSIGRDPGLPELLEALARQTLPRERFETIVVLGAAEPTARICAAADALGARLVRRTASRGPGAARNFGAAHAGAEWLAFTEDDCLPEDDWLAAAFLRLATDPEAEALEGRTTKPGGKPLHRASDRFPYYVPTNLFVKRATFAAMNGYCEDFYDPLTRVYFREDSDFGFRLEARGARVVRAPEVRVTHPDEHATPMGALRWTTRLEMDPLLQRRDPERFRERIEVHRVGPLVVRRPLVRAAWLATLGAAATPFALTGLLRVPPIVPIAAYALGAAVFWAKWRFGPAFLPVALIGPFVALTALLRGTFRVWMMKREKRAAV